MSIKDGRKGKGETINAYHLEARQLLPGVAKKQLNASVATIHLANCVDSMLFHCFYDA